MREWGEEEFLIWRGQLSRESGFGGKVKESICVLCRETTFLGASNCKKGLAKCAALFGVCVCACMMSGETSATIVLAASHRHE